MTIKIQISGNTFILHPTGAAFWEEKRALLISDVHLGKIAHFRKHGVAVPEKAATRNFEQLDVAMAFFGPETVIFLGDLFHSELNNEWQLFEDWILRTSAEIVLIAGNHDIIDRRHYERIGVKVFEELEVDGFRFTHKPSEKSGFFNFCGHIHPGIRIFGSGRQSLRLPCFFHRENQMILPAFGEFTGNYFMIPAETDVVYAVTREEVVLIARN